jgi:DNA-binding MarR family transcriptional regulator
MATVRIANKSTPPELHEAHDLAMALRGAYKTMHRKADSFFIKYGVTADQYVLLHILEKENAITQERLVARASSDPNTVRRMLLLLEGRGFVTRKRNPTDERARSVSLTRKGRSIYKRLRRAFEPFLGLLVSDYLPEEMKTLMGLLRRIPPVMAGRHLQQARGNSAAPVKRK